MKKIKTLVECVNHRDLLTARLLIIQGQNPHEKDNQGFSPYDRAKNLGLTDFCSLFNSPTPESHQPLSTKSNADKKVSKIVKEKNINVTIFKIIFGSLLGYLLFAHFFLDKGKCFDAGWTGAVNESTWSDANYQQCLRDEKNGITNISRKKPSINYPAQQNVVHSTRDKQIFLELINLQDNGYSKETSETKVMEKYNISYEVLLNILSTGAREGWVNDI